MFVHFIYRLRAHTRKKFLIAPDAMCLAVRKKCGWGIQHLLQYPSCLLVGGGKRMKAICLWQALVFFCRALKLFTINASKDLHT